MGVSKVELGRWYEVVTDTDEIIVGQVCGYRVQPHGEVFTRLLYLDGVSPSGPLPIDLSRVRRVKPIASVHLDIATLEV